MPAVPRSGPCSRLALALAQGLSPGGWPASRAAPAQGWWRASAPVDHVVLPAHPIDPRDAAGPVVHRVSEPGCVAEAAALLRDRAPRWQQPVLLHYNFLYDRIPPHDRVPADHARPHASAKPHPLLRHAHPALPQCTICPPTVPALQLQLGHPPPHRPAHKLDEVDEAEEASILCDPELDAAVAFRTAAWVAAAAGAVLDDATPHAFSAEADLRLRGAPAVPLLTAAAAAAAGEARGCCLHTDSSAPSSRRGTGTGMQPRPQTDAHPHAHALTQRPVSRPQLRGSGDGGGGVGGHKGPVTRGASEREVGVPEDPAAVRYLERGMLLSAALKISKGQQAMKRSTSGLGAARQQQQQVLLQKFQSRRSHA